MIDREGVGADQRLGDFQRLLTGRRLGDEQGVDVDPQGFGVGGVEGVLDVDEGRLAARLLGLGDHLQGDGRLAGGFRAVDLDNPALGDAADAEGDVKGERARRDNVDVHRLVLPQPHQRARAILLLDLGNNLVEGFLPLFAGAGDLGTGFVIRCFFCHIVCPSF